MCSKSCADFKNDAATGGVVYDFNARKFVKKNGETVAPPGRSGYDGGRSRDTDDGRSRDTYTRRR